MHPQPVALHAIIEGRVQGVGFRYFVLEQAVNFDLTGWVRNRVRGEVEVYAEGKKETLDLFVSQLERGPGMACVSNITVEWLPAAGDHAKFSIAPTDW